MLYPKMMVASDSRMSTEKEVVECVDRFNTQQLYALPTLYLCVLYLSENKQRLVPLTA